MGIFDSLVQGVTKGVGGGNTSFPTKMNPFFRAMNYDKLTDLSNLSKGKIGSVLYKYGKVNGDTATIINATLDYFLGDSGNSGVSIPKEFENFQYTKGFIPIIIKTEFDYVAVEGSPSQKRPLYIVFDSTPEKIAFSKSANWATKSPQGRPEPVFAYQDSSAMTVTLTGDFFVDSALEHTYKLKLADYIMSLAAPSRDHYMPSPIQVIIGEWKNFRALVTNATVEYKGPWVTSSRDTVAAEATAAAANARYNETAAALSKNGITVDPSQIEDTTMRGYTAEFQGKQSALDSALAEKTAANQLLLVNSIPKHAPYMFTATLTLNVISPANHVNYAEDVIAGAGRKMDGLEADDIAAINKQLTEVSAETTKSYTSLGYNITQTDSGYTFEDGMIKQTSKYQWKVNPEFKYWDANDERRTTDLGLITDAVNNQLTDLISKKLSKSNSPIAKFFFR